MAFYYDYYYCYYYAKKKCFCCKPNPRIKHGICPSFWPKLIGGHLTMKFYRLSPLLAKADVDRVSKRSLKMRIQ